MAAPAQSAPRERHERKGWTRVRATASKRHAFAGRSAQQPPAIVLSLFDTGLGAVRSLGRAGIPVLGLDCNRVNAGFASRYCTARHCPHPVHQPEQLLRSLLDLGRALPLPGIVFPASDAFTLFLSHHREPLGRYFRFNLPAAAILEATINKREQYQLAAHAGTPIATTYYPETPADVERIKDQIAYPAFIKPHYGHLWREQFPGRQSKGIEVRDAAALVDAYRTIFRTGLQALVQSIIIGPNTNHYKVCAYVSQTGDLLALFTLRKIRQYPTDFGVGTLVESVRAPQVAELGWRFLRAIDYRGIGSLEFKRDDRDGALKLIELNPRLWQQNALATASGINFPLLQYRDLTGESPSPQVTFRTGVRWLDLSSDFQAFWSYRQAGTLSTRDWLASLGGVRSFATFALDDPAPFLKANQWGLKYLRAPLYALRHRAR